jgi:uncharacterized integral membrane protein
MNEEQPTTQAPRPSPRRTIAPELIVAVVLAVVLLIFIVQNDEDVKVSWVVFSRRGPVWGVILVSAVLGYLIGQLVEFGVKRRRRGDRSARATRT